VKRRPALLVVAVRLEVIPPQRDARFSPALARAMARAYAAAHSKIRRASLLTTSGFSAMVMRSQTCCVSRVSIVASPINKGTRLRYLLLSISLIHQVGGYGHLWGAVSTG